MGIAPYLPYVQIGLSVLLAVSILLQRSGTDNGGALGSGNDGSMTFHTRRGFEKTLFVATVILAILFVASAFGRLFLLS